jgi:hypothetical protein
LEGRVQAALSACGRQFARCSQTVREDSTDQVFVMFFVCSYELVFRSVLSGAFGCSEFGEQSARRVRIVSSTRMVRG